MENVDNRYKLSKFKDLYLGKSYLEKYLKVILKGTLLQGRDLHYYDLFSCKDCIMNNGDYISREEEMDRLSPFPKMKKDQMRKKRLRNYQLKKTRTTHIWSLNSIMYNRMQKVFNELIKYGFDDVVFTGSTGFLTCDYGSDVDVAVGNTSANIQAAIRLIEYYAGKVGITFCVDLNTIRENFVITLRFALVHIDIQFRPKSEIQSFFVGSMSRLDDYTIQDHIDHILLLRKIRRGVSSVSYLDAKEFVYKKHVSCFIDSIDSNFS